MLDIDTAIKHCLEVADKNEIDAITYKNCKEIKTNMYEKLTAEKAENDCRECAADHRQLAEWLMELKDLRAEQNDQYTFIRELMDELKEAKRLLKAAVEDMSEKYICVKVCKRDNFACRVSDTCDFKWRYADEALKLIGGSEND